MLLMVLALSAANTPLLWLPDLDAIIPTCRVRQVALDLGWVDIDFGHFYYLPHSAWAAGRLAARAVDLGKMTERPNQSQPNPGTLVGKERGKKGKIGFFMVGPGLR